MGGSVNSNLHQNMTDLIEQSCDAPSKESIGPNLLLLERLILGFSDAPVLFKLLEGGLFVEVLRDTIQLYSLDQILAELHESVPASNTLHKSLVLDGLFQRFYVHLESFGQSHEILLRQSVLLHPPRILLHQCLIKLLIKDVSVNTFAENG